MPEKITEIEVGEKVCYQNPNGSWYTGVCLTVEQWHSCNLAYKKIFGVQVDYGDVIQIQKMSDLYSPDSLVLEDDDTEEGILVNVIYDCDWCDMSEESIDKTVKYLKENYNITRKTKS